MAVVTKEGLGIFLSAIDLTRNAQSSCVDGKQATTARKRTIVPVIHSPPKKMVNAPPMPRYFLSLWR
jgi:hypothetical protein